MKTEKKQFTWEEVDMNDENQLFTDDMAKHIYVWSEAIADKPVRKKKSKTESKLS